MKAHAINFEQIGRTMSVEEAQATVNRNANALIDQVRESGLKYSEEYAEYLSLELFGGNSNPISYMTFAIELDEQRALETVFTYTRF